MQTLFNIINVGIAGFLMKPFLYLIKTGLNPYIIFILLIIVLFLSYFLVFYRGNVSILREGFKKMPLKKKRVWFIFLFGGIFVALVLFYESLYLFYDSSDLIKYHSSFVDNVLSNVVGGIISFFEKIGIIK